MSIAIVEDWTQQSDCTDRWAVINEAAMHDTRSQ